MSLKEKDKKSILFAIGLIVFLAIAIPIAAHSDKQNKQTANSSNQNKSKKEVNTSNNSKKDSSVIDEVKEQAKKDTIKDKTYTADMSKKMLILSSDIQQANNFLTSQKYDDLKNFYGYIVKDCNDIENTNPSSTFVDIHNQIKQVCEIYKNVYGNLYDKIQSGDADWINQQKDNLSKANQQIENIAKQIKAVTGE